MTAATPAKPTLLMPQRDAIPAELRAEARWVVFRQEWVPAKDDKPGRWTKPPRNAATGALASSTDETTWSDFETAWKAHRDSVGKKQPWEGVGFVLGGRFIGIDLDGCADPDGNIEPWAADIIRDLDSYSEWSPSGAGIRIVVTGQPLPEGRRQYEFGDRDHHGFGLYDSQQGRYLTITGCTLNGHRTIEERTAQLQSIHAQYFPPQVKAAPAPLPVTGSSPDKGNCPLSDDELILRARSANDGGKFARLWDGDIGGYDSHSEADSALCFKLAFWDRDSGRIDALFRMSKLMRPKWDEKRPGGTYGSATIGEALKLQTQTWKPKRAPAQTAKVNLAALPPDFTTLNALSVLGGLIRFQRVEALDSMIVLTTDDDIEIVFPTAGDLNSFTKARDIISGRANVFLPTPGHREIKQMWEPFPALIYRMVKNTGHVRLGDTWKEEMREMLRKMWRRTGGINRLPTDNAGFIRNIRLCLDTKRDNRENASAPPSVFLYQDKQEGVVFVVHAPTLRTWLSTTQFEYHRYSNEEVRRGLLLLRGRYRENLTRRIPGDHETACVWFLPLDALAEKDAEDPDADPGGETETGD